MYVSTVNSFNTVKDGDVSYKKQTNKMNDDSVSECEIDLTKETYGPVFKSWFSAKLQHIFKKPLQVSIPMFLSVSVWP